MISAIKLENFKCFSEIDLEVKGLNIFTGTNGGGKSSIIQSLLVLRQSFESGNLSHGRIQLNGEMVELGTAREVYSADPGSECIGINLRVTGDPSYHPFISTPEEAQSNTHILNVTAGDKLTLPRCSLFENSFNYLHAERLGPRKTYEIPPNEGYPLSVGRFGQYASFFVTPDIRIKEVKHEPLLLDSSDGKLYSTLGFQWQLWMERLFPGFQGDSQTSWQTDQIRLELALQRTSSGQPHFVRPTNTGFGVAFVLSIVIAGLVAEPESLLIVENPEAHLHPKAQSCIGEFLARTAAAGVQLIVETHSEHVLNGMRRMIKQGILPTERVAVNYFDGSQGRGQPRVIPVTVKENGDIPDWPQGFFDQLDKDISILFEYDGGVPK